MKIKFKKPFFVAIMINLILGAFLILSGILEFTGIINKTNYSSIYTVGVQLSHLVFISGLLTFGSGLFSFFRYKDLKYLNLQILIGAVALAWPVFVALVLFFSQRIICIRLAPTLLASLYYIITILILKMGNEELNKTRKLHIGKVGKISDKRAAKGASVESLFKSKKNPTKQRSANISSSMGKLSMKFKRHSSIHSGKAHRRRRSNKNVLQNMFSKRH